MPNIEPTITVSLKEFLFLTLGQGYWESRPIPKSIAQIVFALTKNKAESGYYIQFNSKDGDILDKPVLWQWSFWAVDHEKTIQQRTYSERQRQERYIFEANVRLVERAYSKYFLVEGDIAHVTAYQYVKKRMTAQMKEIGVVKLYTDVKEL